jgi:NADPH-dependent 2,4-dienoyl-CoA reductase/sulfur reductase-like enzyme
LIPVAPDDGREPANVVGVGVCARLTAVRSMVELRIPLTEVTVRTPASQKELAGIDRGIGLDDVGNLAARIGRQATLERADYAREGTKFGHNAALDNRARTLSSAA